MRHSAQRVLQEGQQQEEGGKGGKRRRRLLDPTPLKVQAALGLIDDEETSAAVLIDTVNKVTRSTRGRLPGQLAMLNYLCSPFPRRYSFRQSLKISLAIQSLKIHVACP